MVIFRTQCEILLHVSRAHSSVQSDEAHAVKTKEKNKLTWFFFFRTQFVLCCSLHSDLFCPLYDLKNTISHRLPSCLNRLLPHLFHLACDSLNRESHRILLRSDREGEHRGLFSLDLSSLLLIGPTVAAILRGWQSLSVVLGNVLHFMNLTLRTGDIERRERTQVSGEYWV